NVVELADDDTSEIPRPAVHVSSSSRPPKRAATSQEVGSFFAPRTTPGAQPTIKSVLAGLISECLMQLLLLGLDIKGQIIML
ncbi:hypothetical protein L195_g057829, partial [Trifolium pratense]